MLTLKVVNYQTGELQEHPLQPESQKLSEWIIGRAAACDLILDSPEVSRVHGRIGYSQGEYHFTDLGSTDGSFINNQTAEINQEYALRQNDLIRVGDFVMSVEDIRIADIPESEGLNPGLQQQSTWTEGELMVQCARVVEETEDVKTFSFVANPPTQFAFQPGQFVTLELEIEGKTVRRSYSISSPPSRSQTLDITVKRVPPPADNPEAAPGLVSNWLHDNIAVGSEVKLLGGPMGKFTCAADSSRKLLMISAGSGVTPMLSMARWLYDTASDRDVIFFNSVRSPRDIIMGQELELMAARQPHFKLAITVTRPVSGQPWFGFTGRLTELMLKQIAPDLPERAVYVCGPDRFMTEVKALLAHLDFPMENYHQESFGVAKKKGKAEAKAVEAPAQPTVESPQSKAASSATPMIYFAQSGKEAVCDPEESILDVAQQHDIEIRSGCMQGVCGACKKRKLAGEVTYQTEPDSLNPDEIAQDYILPCVAMPVGKVTIEA